MLQIKSSNAFLKCYMHSIGALKARTVDITQAVLNLIKVAAKNDGDSYWQACM